MTLVETRQWTVICDYAALVPERGVAAYVEGEQIAVFCAHDGSVYAVSNRDPFSGAYVLSRGIMGSRADAPTVASPLLKQVFDLRSGVCLDDATVAIAVYDVRVRDGVVEVQVT